MRRRYSEPEEAATIDLTPLMDIVFIMLIFFIVTTSFVKDTGLDINRPQASTAAQLDTTSIMVAITTSGGVWIDGQQVDIRMLRNNIERLLAARAVNAVVITADKDSRNGLLVQVMDQARLAGVKHVSIAAQLH